MSGSANIDNLERRLDANWLHLREARARSLATRVALQRLLAPFESEEVSVVVHGSLARDEFTSGSDLDWSLLVDGAADPKRHRLVREIDSRIAEVKAKKPGAEATFGTMVFSHDLVHYIGGQDDTNRNTTRRLLLLLESCCVSGEDPYHRVVRHILDRYVFEDRGLWKGSKYRVPRFLQNDFARYWRTMTVDFAYKQRDRYGNGWALRNMKLRISRKLIYASGLLACFRCHLDHTEESWNTLRKDEDRERLLVDYMSRGFQQTPLEILADILFRFPELDHSARVLFDSYDAFVGVLADADKRKRLDTLTGTEADVDEVFQTTRQLSHSFRDGLLQLFFDEKSGIGELTRNYGVF